MIFGLRGCCRQRSGGHAVVGAAVACVLLVACSGGSDESAPRQAATTPQVSEQDIQTALQSAQTYVGRGDLFSAQAILEELAKKAPDDVRPQEQLGQLLYTRALQADNAGNEPAAAHFRDEAADAYRRAVTIDPDSAGLRQSAGSILLAAGDNDAALEMFEAAGRLDPSNPQHPLFAAQLLIRQKRFDEAAAALKRVLALDDNEPFAHASLAIVAMERGDFETARVEIARARSIDPSNIDFLAHEARIARRSGNPQHAVELLIGLGEQQRGRPAIATEIAGAFRELGKPAQAAEAWIVAYRQRANQPDAWFAAAQAADLLLDAGDRDQALFWIRQAEMMAPDQPQVMALRRKLAQLAGASTQ